MKIPILTKKQTYYVLTFCAVSIILSILMLAHGNTMKVEVSEFSAPTPITVTPLDSYNPCYAQDVWSRVE